MARDSGGLSNLSWGCQLERFVNFFPGACSLFVPLVSMVSQVFWCCQKSLILFCLILFCSLWSPGVQGMPVSQVLSQAKKKPIPLWAPWKSECWMHIPHFSFPLKKEATRVFPSDPDELCSFLSWCYKFCDVVINCWALFGSLWCPDTQDILVPNQHLTSVETETVSQVADPPKAGVLDIYSTLLFLSQERIHELDFSSWLQPVPTWGRRWCGWNKMPFLTHFNVAILAFENALLEIPQLSNL